MVWMKRAIAVGTLGALLAPAIAWAGDYPRSVTINGNRCQQSLTEAGTRETWCLIDGKPTKMKEAPSDVLPASFRPSGIAPAATAISPQAADHLGNAAVKYSWSGPFKWGAITAAVAGVLILASGAEDSGKLAVFALGLGSINLGIALAIDGSARKDLDRAAGRLQ